MISSKTQPERLTSILFIPNLYPSLKYKNTNKMMKLAGRKSVLKPPVVYSVDRSKAAVPVLVLLFVALWFSL